MRPRGNTHHQKRFSLRITLFISSLRIGGAERVLSELANAWILKGYDVTLITLAPLTEKPSYPLNHRISLVQLNQLWEEKSSFLMRLVRILRRVLKLRKALKNSQPDVIVSFVEMANMIAILANLRLTIPLIVCERTNPHYYRIPFLYEKLRNLLYPLASKIITQTFSAASYFPQLPNHQKMIIPNMVRRFDSCKEETDILKPVQKIVTMGRLCESKDFQTLIHAFSQVILHNPRMLLTIYGEGPERGNLESLVQDLRLSQHVFLPGTIENVQEALCASDLFIFPSRFEGFPNALCEAMAVGLPVIASDCSGNIDLIKDGVNGRLFPVGDVKQLATLMEELLHDSTQRLKLAQEAAKLPENYSEERILKLWDDGLEEVKQS